MENVSKACIIVGVLLTGVGGIMGALFMVSDDFVVARISCLESSGNAECPSDGFVQFDGSDCQVGNLGLYESAFTPNCADGTPYALSEAVDEFEGDPLEFGPLFPAQTGLAGILNDFSALGAEPEFESCEAYFADDGALETFLAQAGGLTVAAGLADLDTTIKTFYEGAIDIVAAGTDTFFTGLGANLVSVAWGQLIVAGCVSLAPVPVNRSQSVNVLATPGCNDFGVATATFEAAVLNNIAVDLAIGILAAAFTADATATDNAAVSASTGLATNSQDDGGPISGVSGNGMWSRFHGDTNTPAESTLCLNIGLGAVTVCSYIDILETIVSALLTGTSEAELQAQGLLSFWQGSEAGLIELVPGFTDRDAMEAEVEGSPTPSPFLGKAEFITNAKGNVDAGDGIPPVGNDPGQITDYTAPFSSNNDTGTNSLAILCADLGPDCTWLELITATSTNPDLSAEDQASLSIISDTLTDCVTSPSLAPVPNVDKDFVTCFLANNKFPQPTFGGLSLADRTAQSILGTLYSAIEITGIETIEQVMAAAIPECKDDEKDAEAIENAQALAPAGTAFMFIGAVVGLLVLVKPSPSKIGGIVAGILGLVGGILFLAALLGVQQAPVFDAVGSDDPLVDNEIVYETGAAAVVAAGTIGLGIAGPIVMIAGFVLLPKADTGADIMSGGKY